MYSRKALEVWGSLLEEILELKNERDWIGKKRERERESNTKELVSF
jgi:hypothetical protein